MEEVRERFLSKVQQSEGCWMWTAATDRYGYGVFWLGAKTKAHRVSWTLFRGSVPPGKLVLHRCNERRCVNPEHLYVGTARENAADTVRARRCGAWTKPHRRAYGDRNGSRTKPEKLCRGEKHPSATLRELDVRKIRSLRSAGWSGTRIAASLRISRSRVYDVLSGGSWRHVL